jgi:cytochrome c oxidase assembly protein subunit 15
MSSRPFNWPHAIACLLVAATAVLLCFGALVTTFDAAMAVPDWPATYGHNMFLFPFAEWFYGPWDLFLEHGHRLLGATVGMISLALAAAVWLREPSATVRGLVVAAVLLVVVQGALGGARVLLDDKTVAKVHACTGPLFFAVAVAIAALTRRPSASRAADVATPAAAAVRSAAGLVVASYVQLVAGAQLRHLDASVEPATFRWLVAFHLLGAVAVAACAAAACWSTLSAGRAGPRRWSLAILLLVGCQIALGCGAWIVNWGLPSAWLPESWRLSEAMVARTAWGAAVVTGHVVLGMLILGAAVVLTIAAGGLAGRPTLGSRFEEAGGRRAFA